MESVNPTEIISCPNARCGQQLRVPAGEVLMVTCPSCEASFTHRPHTQGKRLSQEFRTKSWTLGELMIAISRESMTLLKRQVPQALGTMERKQEWEGFIEFLKVLFNMVDRVATLYVPVSEYLQFLDAVEGAVIDQMNNAFRKQAGKHGIRLDLKSQLLYDDRHVFVNGTAVPWPQRSRETLRRLADHRALSPDAAARVSTAAAAILYNWYRDGYVHTGIA